MTNKERDVKFTEYVGVSRETVYTWLGDKGLSGHRVGRLWKFKREEVDDWVRAVDALGRGKKPM